jgi:predicted ABC-type ATPase
LGPELAAIAAGRMVLRELSRLVEARAEFAIESTLSGVHYAKRLEDWKGRGYLIEIVYIRPASPQLALSRIASGVRLGAKMSLDRCYTAIQVPVDQFPQCLLAAGGSLGNI